MGRDQARLDAQAAIIAKAHGVAVAAVRCDVSDAASVARRLPHRAREARHAVHPREQCRPGARGRPFTATTLALWNQLIGVNLTGTFLCMQQVVPAMIEAKAGRIVNIASISGLRGVPEGGGVHARRSTA